MMERRPPVSRRRSLNSQRASAHSMRPGRDDDDDDDDEGEDAAVGWSVSALDRVDKGSSAAVVVCFCFCCSVLSPPSTSPPSSLPPRHFLPPSCIAAAVPHSYAFLPLSSPPARVPSLHSPPPIVFPMTSSSSTTSSSCMLHHRVAHSPRHDHEQPCTGRPQRRRRRRVTRLLVAGRRHPTARIAPPSPFHRHRSRLSSLSPLPPRPPSPHTQPSLLALLLPTPPPSYHLHLP